MTKSASCIDEDEAVVKHMEKACRDLNHPVVISGTPQHDDADYLYNMGHIPTIIFGPGQTKMGHVPNECVEIDDTIKACKIYIAFLYNALKA